MRSLCQSDLKQQLFARREVDPVTKCWLWIGSKDGAGYGTLSNGGKIHKAHRAAYGVFVGPIPDGMLVCHRCDTPPCFNPEHLFVGSQSDNMQDMARKGRHPYPRGDRHHGAKMTESDVVCILAASKFGLQTVDISRKLNLPYFSVHDVVRGKSWTHIDRSTIPVLDELFGTRYDALMGPSLIKRPNRCGSQNSHHKLTEGDIIAIRRDLRDGKATKEISLQYGVGVKTIWYIKAGRTWAHVPLERAVA